MRLAKYNLIRKFHVSQSKYDRIFAN